MLVTFGDFIELQDPDFVKEQLRIILEVFKTDKYNQIYVAYPHMLFSDDYKPEKSSKKQLEIYMFSLPKVFGSCEITRHSSFIFNGEEYFLDAGQKDTLEPQGGIPAGYTEVFDETGKRVAIHKDNQLWILSDLFHRVTSGSTVLATSATSSFMGIIQEIISPLSPEEKAKIYQKNITKFIMKSVEKNFQYLNNDLEHKKRNLQAIEKDFIARLKDFQTQTKLVESLELIGEEDALKIVQDILIMPFVESVESRGLNEMIVKTKKIHLGPFNYGKWTITYSIRRDKVIMQNEGKVIHPYCFGSGEYCFGGFTDNLYTYINAGQFNNALAIVRMLITNYSISTAMHKIEPYLQSVMGKKKFEDALNSLIKTPEFSAENYFLKISTIIGNKITVTGKRRSEANPELPQTFRRIVEV